MKILRVVALFFVLLASNSVFASDWPQYLGPNRDATSDEKGLLRSWPADGPKELWTIPMGEGYGGPAISEGKVYVYDWVENKTAILRCIDLISGKEEWNFKYEASRSGGEYKGSKSVPTVDGDKIYICDQFGNLNCVDKKSHKSIWHKNIWTDFGGTDLPDFEIAQSPLIYENLVIVASQTQGAGVVAYDKQTGNIIWKTASLPGKTGYMSPMLLKISGTDQVVMLSGAGMKMAEGSTPPTGQNAPGGAQGSAPPAGQGAPGGAQGTAPGSGQGAAPGPGAAPTIDVTKKGALSGFNAKTGALLWTYTGFQSMRPIANVTAMGNNRLFIYGGDGGSAGTSAIIQIEKTGNSFTVKELLKPNEFGSTIHPAIFYKDYLYGNWSTLTAQNGMVCMDLSGAVKWKTKKNPLFDKGGLILADDMIINNGNGTFYLIEPTPAGFKMLSKAKLLDKNEEYAPFALSDGKLVVRGKTQMKCVQVK
jgi:outer membrane protein assembly factor BamB